MKIKNISLRTYQHGIYTIKSGAEISVPDNIAKMLLRTKEFILLEEVKPVEHTYEIGELPKPDISKATTKKEVKKSVNTRKGNRKRI